ncbi:MAG TPA: glycosyltransferase family 39 protein [Planctomycetes bacterium]|nr:glycosyltransferase family 39 protein [Planctomycetota bacterium]
MRRSLKRAILRRPGLSLLLLFLLAFLVSASGIGHFPLLDVDEPRFAAASREMLKPGGDWIIPHFNGHERFDKPILIYWLQAGAMSIFGPGALGARLPSALALGIAAPLTALIGFELGLSFLLALLSGLILVTTAQAQIMGHAATADGVMLAFVLAAIWMQVQRFRRGPGAWNFLGLWGFLGLAFLTKGPPALVAPLALGVGILWAGGRPRFRSVFLGLCLLVAMVLAWGLPALERSEGRLWTMGLMKHVVERSLRPFEGHGGFAPWWYLFYLVSVPLTFLPWSPFLVHGIAWWRRAVGGIEAEAAKVLGGWILGTLLVFTLVTSKMPHYPLPCFPALAILLGFGLERKVYQGHRPAYLFFGLGVLLLLLFPILPLAEGLDRGFPHALQIGAALFLGCFLAGRMIRRRFPLKASLFLALGAVVGFSLLGGRLLPSVGPYFLTPRAAPLLRPYLSDGLPMYRFRVVAPSLVFLLDHPLPLLDARGKKTPYKWGLEAMGRGQLRILTRKGKIPFLRDGLPGIADPKLRARVQRYLEEPLVQQKGWYPGRGRWWTLVLLGKALPSR